MNGPIFVKGKAMRKAFLLFVAPMILNAQTPSSHDTMSLRRVPEWAKKAIWYQIFPERFANGDSGNDPTPPDMEGAWPHKIPEGWKVSRWNSDWYALQPWERANKHDFYWNAGTRRYGGDIQGIIDHLDYLQNLGITAIYLNPIFDSPSLHKYDTRMYHHIDRNFGPDPSGDLALIASENPADPSTWKWTSADRLFLKLVQDVHARGMKIILDGVFNHVGTSFWAFQDVVKHQQKSKFKDWFKIRSWDDPKTAASEFAYEGWNGVKDLPEVNKNGTYDLADGFAEHIHAILKRWMDPNGDGNPSDGIDGWRLDVAEKVSVKFWRQFRLWVKALNPDAYITGEIWWEDWQKNRMFDASPWLQGDTFDGVMNYRFARAVKQFVADQRNQVSAQAFADRLNSVLREYPWENVLALQNLMDSHDVDRVASQIVNPDRWYDHYANPAQNRTYEVRKPTPLERLKQKLMVGIQMTMPGSPMVYYGDEAGMWGGDDPDCRKPMVWENIRYEPESSDPLGRKRLPDSVSFDHDLFGWYKKIIDIRKNFAPLSEGDLKFLKIDNANHVIVYSRTLQGDTAIVAVNNSDEGNLVDLGTASAPFRTGTVMNLVDGMVYSAKDGSCQLPMKPYEIVILREK